MGLKSIIKNIFNAANLDVYPDAVMIINSANDIVGWNNKAEKLFQECPGMRAVS